MAGNKKKRLAYSSSSSSSSSSDEERPPVSKAKNRLLSQTKASQSTSQSGPSQSQNAISPNELRRIACLCANFFLVANCRKLPMKVSDVKKMIPKENLRRTAEIIRSASTILEETFGYKVIEMEKASFMLLNTLDLSDVFGSTPPPFPFQPLEAGVVVLRTNILMVIMMSGGVVSEAVLREFLKTFDINLDSKIPHQILGNVYKLVYQDFVRQGYLKVSQLAVEPPVTEIRWGPRSEKELSKKELVEMVCKIYGNDIRPEMWIDQWKLALEEEAAASQNSAA